MRAEYSRSRSRRECTGTGAWKYCSDLPPLSKIVSLGEGNTPLVESTSVARELRVYFKDEGRNPTGSIRDRAASVVVSHATSTGAKGIIAASDGNMAVSVVAYSARAGFKAVIHAPAWIDWEKALLIKVYGGSLVVEDKSIDVLVREVEERAREKRLYNATSTWNTLSIEGLKTLAYEIVEQLGKAPRAVYVPLGSGLTYLSLYIGFRELAERGLISRTPL
ncbi:MAG: pyridoxal-phosphate dependent enzyme, partial [Desulfurococcaceae archaeon]